MLHWRQASDHTTMIEVVDGTRYYVHPKSIVRISILLKVKLTFKGHVEGTGNHGPIPAVLISSTDGVPSSSIISHTIQHFKVVDDVFSPLFQSTLVIQVPESQVHDLNINDSGLKSGFPHILLSSFEAAADALPSGPYFVNQGHIHQAWRLYEDILDAFIIPVVPEQPLQPSRYRFFISL